LFEIVLEAFQDIIKTLPLLLAVYILLYYIENRLTDAPALLSRAARFGPLVGAAAGTVPQCGFSAAAAALFSSGYLAPETVLAVFLATSDEAIPVLVADGATVSQIVALIAVKFIWAVISGYFLRITLFRLYRLPGRPSHAVEKVSVSSCDCGQHHSPAAAILWRTLKTGGFLFIILLALNLCIVWIGEERIAAILLMDSIFQPLLCAVLGLTPSCAMSVLLAELYMNGTISFGALIAGLSTGAGFGYMVLLKEKEGRRRAVVVIAAAFFAAVIGGTLVQILFPSI